MAGAVLAVALLLAQPFVTRDWPAQVKALVSSPAIRTILAIAVYTVVFVFGFSPSKRRR